MAEETEEKTLIHLKRNFPVPIRPLFEAFLSAEQFKEWFSPPGFEAGRFTLDPVIGGEYNCEFLKQAKPVLVIKGKYIEIDKFSKIIFTLMYDPDMSSIGECRVTVRFNEKGTNTEIVLLQEIFKSIDPEGRTKGWEFMFGRLEEILK